jgi:L-serine dehydratase
MRDCIAHGLVTHGQLPGGLNVKRRAAVLWKQEQDAMQAEVRRNELPHDALNLVSLYAMAVNEENAAGGRVVTAPTNGAAGIIPAVLRYYAEDCRPSEPARGVRDFLLTSAAIGMLCKRNASISGAEIGCQGEVGVACAMAAAGLVAALGGTNEQIENAAEIGIEHHLGMTCDPIGGLVQIPCIERNGMGAIKAITAASLALKGDGTHFVSLDDVIETMRQTGFDMQAKYKETSLGGLAIHVVTVNHAAC